MDCCRGRFQLRNLMVLSRGRLRHISTLRSLAPAIDDSVANATADALVARWENPESAEGIDAFFGKRKPHWAF